MHRSRLGALIIDCHTDDLSGATEFWSAALGWARGDADAEGKYVGLRTPPEEVQVELQKVDHPSRVHLDIESDDLDAEVARLKALGAEEVARIRDWCVMQAPTGHRFCVVKPQRADFERLANQWK